MNGIRNGILIIAHTPLASALYKCAEHVHGQMKENKLDKLAALDVLPNLSREETLGQARIMLRQLGSPHTLVLTDVIGGSPYKVAEELVDGIQSKLIVGVNLPMLLRAINYQTEPLDAMVARAIVGAMQGVMQVSNTAPQNQARRSYDQNHHEHQQ